MPQFKTLHLSQHKVPEFVEKPMNKGWVLNGEEDKYPLYLLELFNRSSVHNALVLGKASYIYGKGLETDNPTVQAFIDKANPTETLNEVFKKCAIDGELYGSYYLNIVWSNGGSIAEIYHVAYESMRSDEENEVFFYSKKFTGEKKVSANDKSIEVFPAFSLENRTGSQVLYIKNYRPGIKTYSLPDYIGANAAIETNVEINNYHLNNIKNGFSGGYLINFKNGEPTAEEQKAIYKKIEEQHTGSDSAGRIVLIFSEGPSDAPDIVPLTPADLDKMFEQLRKDTNEEIFIGHRVVSPMLFGIKTEGQLGGVTELKTSFEIFKSTVIQEKQAKFKEVFGTLIEIATKQQDAITLEAIPPVNEDVSLDKLLPDLTQDERRELAGYEPLPSDGQTAEKSLAEVIGVGGVQSLQAVLADPAMLPDAKVQFLIVVFAINEEDAKRLVYGDAGQPVDPAAPAVFSRHKKDKQKDKDEFNVFNEFGRVVPEEELAAYARRDLDFVDEKPVLYMFDTLTAIEKKAISIARDNPNIEIGELAEALEIDADEAAELLKGLSKKELIWTKKGKVSITKKGDTIADNTDLPEYDVVYRYEKSPDAQGPAILPNGRTRDFCELMIRANKVYTRQEIDAIGDRLGYNVWKFRGGWYHNAEGENTPYCRHVWVQYVIKKKK